MLTAVLNVVQEAEKNPPLQRPSTKTYFYQVVCLGDVCLLTVTYHVLWCGLLLMKTSRRFRWTEQRHLHEDPMTALTLSWSRNYLLPQRSYIFWSKNWQSWKDMPTYYTSQSSGHLVKAARRTDATTLSSGISCLWHQKGIWEHLGCSRPSFGDVLPQHAFWCERQASEKKSPTDGPRMYYFTLCREANPSRPVNWMIGT
jgi:hypothetical protein